MNCKKIFRFFIVFLIAAVYKIFFLYFESVILHTIFPFIKSIQYMSSYSVPDLCNSIFLAVLYNNLFNFLLFDM